VLYFDLLCEQFIDNESTAKLAEQKNLHVFEPGAKNAKAGVDIFLGKKHNYWWMDRFSGVDFERKMGLPVSNFKRIKGINYLVGKNTAKQN